VAHNRGNGSKRTFIAFFYFAAYLRQYENITKKETANSIPAGTYCN
jgi:hypothetical protein